MTEYRMNTMTPFRNSQIDVTVTPEAGAVYVERSLPEANKGSEALFGVDEFVHYAEMLWAIAQPLRRKVDGMAPMHDASFYRKLTIVKRTDILMVIDESSSMASQQQNVILGHNKYVAEQRVQPNTFATLMKFHARSLFNVLRTYGDSGINTNNSEYVYKQLPVHRVPDLNAATYSPMGDTPLFDAIGDMIGYGKTLGSDQVLLVIMTDGQENASKRYTLDNVRQQIAEVTARGWGIIFIGANIDSFAMGQSIGISKGNISNYRADHANEAWNIAQRGTQAYYAASSTGAGVASLLDDDEE